MMENKGLGGEPMRRPILPLPPQIVERIAAGEVVERPAAVVKELVENSLDAGATWISVIIQDAGRSLIKVVDNGIGMTPEEMRMALARHATSKIRTFEDLEHLQTYGFRGEALPSIGAVSRMELVSRAQGSDLGFKLRVEGGVIVGEEPGFFPVGTSVAVSHLFYNVPARRKFLRSDATEFKWIALIFKHFALIYPQWGFELYRDGEILYRLAPGNREDRLREFYGEDIVEEMIPVQHRVGPFEVEGYLGVIESGKQLMKESFLFVNRRPVSHPRLAKAIQNGVESYLPSGASLLYVLNFSCPPDRCDINVHPAKREVKFADEQGAYTAMWSAVREAIDRRRRPDGLISHSPSAMPVRMPSSRRGTPMATGRRVTTSSERIPIRSPEHLVPYSPVPLAHKGPLISLPFASLPPSVASTTSLGHPFPDESLQEPLIRSPVTLPLVFQIFDTYLVSYISSGLVFIDQHVAHERVLYERALGALENEPWARQHLLFPVEFTIAPEDKAILTELIPLFLAMGMELELGERWGRLLSLPAGLQVDNERQLLEGILQEIRQGYKTGADPRHQLAAAFACHSAIKAGLPLMLEERVQLIDELFRTAEPYVCPHGRPIVHILEKREIDKWFKR
ncbi:MAG: DNA mismatch repair endonuclease MutL [bacterium]